MGYLLKDHRSTVDPTGTRDGRLEEWDTVACCHCQAVIKRIIRGPCRTDIDSPGECDHCRKPVCHACSAILIANGTCPGEMRAKIQRAWEEFNRADALLFSMRR